VKDNTKPSPDQKRIRGLIKEITQRVVEEENLELDDETLWLIQEEVLIRVLRELEKRREEKAREKPKKEKEEREEYFVRFSLNIRVQHLVLAISVLLLIFTGLPIKFHESAWATFLLKLMGGIKVSRIIHRIAAAMLTGVGVYHLFWIIFTKAGRRELFELLPKPKDFKDFYINIRYYLGLSKERPKFGRYSYIEKFDYWAVYWGMVIMIGSGLILTFFPYLIGILPKYVFDIAREAHSDEALLATLAIVIWHWYNAHFNPEVFPMNPTIFTGKISKERMLREHPLEYEKLILEQIQKMKADREKRKAESRQVDEPTTIKEPME